MGIIPIITGNDYSMLVLDMVGGDETNEIYKLIKNLGKGNAKDLNYLWYCLVGFQILNNIFTNSIIPNFTEYSKFIVYSSTSCLNKCCACCIASTQEELEEI